jgi:hypothetical protein
MLTIQPPIIRKYFTFRTLVNPRNTVYRSFYLSWEDALWHLLELYKVPVRAKVLVPEFFCGHVVENMQQHGLTVSYYPVDSLMRTRSDELASTIKKIKPDILIIFHPVGIHNQLINDSTDWFNHLDTDYLLIEDCVHMLVNTQKIGFLSEHHFLIDSLRKVVPIQGSNVHSSVLLPKVNMLTSILTLPYRLTVMTWWALMQINLIKAYLSKSSSAEMKYNLRAEQAMIKGYEVIGDNQLASPGMSLMRYLASHIAVDRIENIKQKQAELYLRGLANLLKQVHVWLPQMKAADYKNLRGFPVIMDIAIADQILLHLRSNGILVRFELNDSKWSQKQKIIYLPMGIYVSTVDIERIVSAVNNCPPFPLIT